MAQQHLDTVITGLGLTTDDLKAIMDAPADSADFKVDDYLGKVTTNVTTKIKNDAKFWEELDEKNIGEPLMKKIETAQYGRAANIAKQKVQKALGLTDADIADFTDDEKGKYELFVAKAAERFTSSKTTDKQLQAQLLEERKKLETLEASIPEKESALKTKMEADYASRTLGLIALTELSRVEGLTSPAKYVLPQLIQELNDTYAFEVVGFEAKPRQKDKPTLAVIEGSKELTMADVINKILTRDKLIVEGKKEDGGKEKGKTKVDVNPENGGLQISSHIMDNINKNIPKGN